MRSQRVTIVSGETGCGKTTKIPQHIIDERDLVPDGKLVVVTQPRRLAAVCVAERVAAERGETVGGSVGYQIRFDNCTSDETRLIYCTTGMLMRRLHHDPLFSRIAVLIIDEVHERDLCTEFLLLVVRARLRAMRGLRLVLMSATLSAASFAGFFCPAPRVLRIEGRAFPVREAFLEEALQWTGYAWPGAEHVPQGVLEYMRTRVASWCSDATIRSICCWHGRSIPTEFIAVLLSQLDAAATPLDDRRGAVLVFLPGLHDIQALSAELVSQPNLWVLPLHSMLDPVQQRKAFAPSPPGRRKVVLSTDVAETSVTIDDIDFVINSGVAKERVHDPATGLGDLEMVQNTRANVEQRRGRAGRLREGACLHLFPKFALERMQRHSMPEMLSRPLEEVVLQLLALRIGEPYATLAAGLSPPAPEAVEDALSLLRAMGAVAPAFGDVGLPRLTRLGQLLSFLPLHPMSAKALLFGAKFGVLRPVAAVVALLNLRSPFARKVSVLKSEDSRKHGPTCGPDSLQRLSRGEPSDHCALASALLGFAQACKRDGVTAGHEFAASHELTTEVLEMALTLADALVAAMVERGYDASFDQEDCGAFCDGAIHEMALFKLVLCLGFAPQFVSLDCGACTDRGEEVEFHPSSVNCLVEPPAEDAKAEDGEWAVYSDAMRLSRINLMESTIVGGNYLLLAAQHALIRGRHALGQSALEEQGGEVELWLDGWCVSLRLMIGYNL